jgi:hypothetical protein
MFVPVLDVREANSKLDPVQPKTNGKQSAEKQSTAGLD